MGWKKSIKAFIIILGRFRLNLTNLLITFTKGSTYSHPSSRSAQGQSVGGSSSVISWHPPCRAPDYPQIPPTMANKASPRLVPIPLTPLPGSPRFPSSPSSSISFFSSYHSDDLSFMESEPFIQQRPFPLPSTPTPSSSASSSTPSLPSPPSSSTIP